MIEGIRNGMVMQRDESNSCRIFLYSDVSLQSVVCWDQNGTHVSAFLEKMGDRWLLSGIPVGGPYRLQLNDFCFKDIYVGDVWILAGQSNMEGNGILTDADFSYQDRPEIRAFYMTDEWRPARNPMHHVGQAVDKVHRSVYCGGNQPEGVGVGSGLSFACKMYAYTHVPQGLIPCAHGGISILHWNFEIPNDNGEKTLYGAMMRRIRVNGSNIRGLFWYQGCSDCTLEWIDNFSESTQCFFSRMREQIGFDFPILQVQIGRYASGFSMEEKHPFCWSFIRQEQLNLKKTVSNSDLIATITYRLDDDMHLSGYSQQKLGEQAAEAMLCLTEPAVAEKQGLKPGMEIVSIKLRNGVFYNYCSEIVIAVANVHGTLVAEPAAYGFRLSEDRMQLVENIYPYDCFTEKEEIHVRWKLPPEKLKNYFLYYGYGCCPDCNIRDEKGYPLPCFGPVALDTCEIVP